jgi:hypothetical protein
LTSITKVAELAGVAAEIALAEVAEVSGNIFKMTLILLLYSAYLFRAAIYTLMFVLHKR